MSNPSDGPSTGRRTVLNLSQVEEQLFGCGTYWFLRLGMILASMDHRQKRKHPVENHISTKTSQVPSDNAKTRNFWPEPQLCSATQRTYGLFDSLSCVARCSNVIPSSERPACVYLVTTLAKSKHMPLANALCAHVRASAYRDSNTTLMPSELFCMGSEDCHCTQQVTGSTLSLTNLTLKVKGKSTSVYETQATRAFPL